MRTRFEIVRTDAGHHVRLRASNGRIVWTTEVYERRRAAVTAIELVAGPLRPSATRRWPEVDLRGHVPVEVHDIDERGQA